MRNPNTPPVSRYYGDKCARTMEEAFGHGAQLDQVPDDFDAAACMVLGAIFFAGFVALCVSLWVLLV